VSCRKDGVKVFHTRGPATLKLLSPKLVYVRGTAHVLSYADRSERRPLLATRLMSSARYLSTWVHGLAVTGAPGMPLYSQSVAYWQPMQLLQNWCGMVTPSGTSNSNVPQRSGLTAAFRAHHTTGSCSRPSADECLDQCLNSVSRKWKLFISKQMTKGDLRH